MHFTLAMSTLFGKKVLGETIKGFKRVCPQAALFGFSTNHLKGF